MVPNIQKNLPDTVVIGIDNDKTLIREASLSYGLYVHGDAGKDNFPPDFFDNVQIKYSMLDIINKIEVIDQLYSVMKKNSMLFVADYNIDHPVLLHHPMARFHDPMENLEKMRYYFQEHGIIYKDDIIYSVFEKNDLRRSKYNSTAETRDR